MRKMALKVVSNIEEIIASIALVIMVAITFRNCLGRYFFNAPLSWGDELSLMMAAWATFLGVPAAYKRNQHLGMEFFLNRLEPKHRLKMQRVLVFVTACLFVLLMVYAWQLVLTTSKRTAIMRLSYKYIYSSAAIGFTFMSFDALKYLYQSFFCKEKFSERFLPQDADEAELAEGETRT